MCRARRAWVLIGALCMGIPGAAAAQTFEAGVKGGFAVTSVPLAGEVFDQVVGQPSIESSSKVGLTGGGYVQFPISNRFSFQPEGLFVMKGVKLTMAAGGGNLSVRLYYLDVPMLVRYRIADNSRTPAYLLAGPTFGIKLGSSTTLEAPGQTIDIDANPALKTLDVGLAFAGGIERGDYLIEGRFTPGITDIGSPSFPHLDSLRNRTFSVLVGVKLR